MTRPELLAPAGDMERLRMAVEYGADAVYLGGKSYSMRAAPLNFTDEELFEAVRFAHGRGVKVYVACNILPPNREIDALPGFLSAVERARADALIISDLGVLSLAKRYAPSAALHISTQVGIVNYAAANACFELGARRVVLARELSLRDIAEIRRRTPDSLELEAFVHGSMCVSVSGRCLLSDYLASRSANRGECAQPCRWNYALMEENRPGEALPIEESGGFTRILSSRDLRMLGHIPELVAAGVTSLKIEGRAKSAYYTAVVTNAYRLAIDACLRGEPTDPRLFGELDKVSHRDYSTGFYFGPFRNGQDFSDQSYRREWDVIAVVEKTAGERAFCRQRNRFAEGDKAELLEPGGFSRAVRLEGLLDAEGQPLREAATPDMELSLRFPFVPKPWSVLRKPVR